MDNKISLPRIQLSVIVPCFNEFGFIDECIVSIMDALHGISAEVIVADGGSDDGTLACIDSLVANYPEILRVIHNDKKYQVFGLNLAISVACGEYIVRCDAHSIYPKSYFSNILSFYNLDLEKRYGNIGIPYRTAVDVGNGLSGGIALAMSSRLGVGSSHRTVSASVRPVNVDTLLFGAWRRSIFHDIGLFDTAFIRGQDYEHNLRIRRAGMLVSIINGEPFKYFTRMSFRKMRRMIFQYAYVKGQLVRRDRELPNIRSTVPILFVLAIAGTAIFAFPVSLTLVAVYIASLTVASLVKLRSVPVRKVLGMLVAIPQMHLAHAAGFMLGLVSNPRRQVFIRKAGHTR